MLKSLSIGTEIARSLVANRVWQNHARATGCKALMFHVMTIRSHREIMLRT